MDIIDRNTGKRISNDEKQNNKELGKSDPIKRNVEKDLEMQENSPMDPPGAYDGSTIEDVPYESMNKILQAFMDDHKAANSKVEAFEKSLADFKEASYELNDEINQNFREFFEFFDNKILDHNRREEKDLFPLLHKKLIDSGEHGEGNEPSTAVDMMEDDHIKFIQLGTLTFNFMGLAARIHDARSKTFIYDVAYNNGRELVEMLKLHIYREDNVLFPLAHKLISEEEFALMSK